MSWLPFIFFFINILLEERRNPVLVKVSEVPLLLGVRLVTRLQPELQRVPGHLETEAGVEVLQGGQPGVVAPDVRVTVTADELHVVVIGTAWRPGSDTENVVTQTAVRPVVPVLVPFLTCAVEHEDGQTDIVVPVLLVQTELVVIVADLSTADNEVLTETGGHVLHVPVEVL